MTLLIINLFSACTSRGDDHKIPNQEVMRMSATRVTLIDDHANNANVYGDGDGVGDDNDVNDDGNKENVRNDRNESYYNIGNEDDTNNDRYDDVNDDCDVSYYVIGNEDYVDNNG